jgi:hypothetical protein
LGGALQTKEARVVSQLTHSPVFKLAKDQVPAMLKLVADRRKVRIEAVLDKALNGRSLALER